MATDWIKLHRQILDGPIWQNAHLLRLWSYLLLKANWKPCQWIIPGTLTPITVDRGQLVTGRETLWQELYGKYSAEKPPVSRTLWRWVEFLRDSGSIKTQNLSNRATLITICNYSTYQDSASDECPTGVQPASNQRPAGVQPASTIEEGKKVRREEDNTPGPQAALPPGAPQPAKPSTKQPKATDQEIEAACQALPEGLRDAAARWHAYKTARRERYTVQGLQQFNAAVTERAAQYGHAAVIEALMAAASNNYQGWNHPGAWSRTNGSTRQHRSNELARHDPSRPAGRF